MRADSVGFFWDDTPIEKPKKEKQVRTPPEAVWLADDYLPGLQQALAFPVQLMSDADLALAKSLGDELVYDTECYVDYWLAMFTNLRTGAVAYVECVDGEPLTRDSIMRLQWAAHQL